MASQMLHTRALGLEVQRQLLRESEFMPNTLDSIKSVVAQEVGAGRLNDNLMPLKAVNVLEGQRYTEHSNCGWVDRVFWKCWDTKEIPTMGEGLTGRKCG